MISLGLNVCFINVLDTDEEMKNDQLILEAEMEGYLKELGYGA